MRLHPIVNSACKPEPSKGHALAALDAEVIKVIISRAPVGCSNRSTDNCYRTLAIGVDNGLYTLQA
jgi:hypothetical protein